MSYGDYRLDYLDERAETRFIFICILAIFFVILTAIGIRLTQAPDTRAQSTVFIDSDKGTGSGVYLGNGYVLTAEHVATMGENLTVVASDHRKYVAKILWTNAAYDFALLQIDHNANIVPSRLACRNPKLGEELTAKGYPMGLGFIQTTGRVTGTARGYIDLTWVVPMDVSIGPGSSGGPIYDAKGFVLGLTDAALTKPTMFGGIPQPGFYFMIPAKAFCALRGEF